MRIQHDTYRSTTLTLVDGRRPLHRSSECPLCHRTHDFKTYHLRLDDVGSVIVSPEIVERLKSLPASGGFSVSGEVAKPPAQRIVIGGPVEGPELTVHPTLIDPR